MSSDDPHAVVPRSLADFPFVRVRDRVAFVGASTARPMAPFLATGLLGRAQLARIEEKLGSLGRRGLFRVLILHHPPTARATGLRKRLADAADLRAVIARVGAELVVHGHTHLASVGLLRSPHGATPVIGTPAASAARASGKSRYARYHLYRIDFGSPQPRVQLEVRGLDAATMSFVTEQRSELAVPWRCTRSEAAVA